MHIHVVYMLVNEPNRLTQSTIGILTLDKKGVSIEGPCSRRLLRYSEFVVSARDGTISHHS
jgi:hypothetical protein